MPHTQIFAKVVQQANGTSLSVTADDSTTNAEKRLQQAVANPEYLLDHWINLPVAPSTKSRQIHHLRLREAILLALRYNPNIQSAELDRIVQRYQLRLAHNEFEVQYALSGAAAVQKNRYEGVGSATNSSILGAPEVDLKTAYGSQFSLNVENNVSNYNSYSPVLNLSLTQPLLRGFGRDVNEVNLRNAIDNEDMNKLRLRQAVTDQITQVIIAYRALILSGNNLQNQRMQLEEANKTFSINERKIKAGQLEPTANIQQSYQIESLKLMVEQATNDFAIASQNLLGAIGLDPAMKLAVPNDVDIGTVKIPDQQQAVAIALANNMQYQALKMALRADERAYKAAQNEQLWQLDVGANVQTGMVSDVDGNNGLKGIYNGHNINETAQIKLTIPIRDINRRSQLVNAKVQLEKDRLNLIAGRRALITAITNTITNIQSQARRYQLAVKQANLAAQSYSLEKKKLAAGISSALDVSNTQNQLIQAQSGLISAKIDYLNQIAALQQFLGTTLNEWQIKLRFGQ